MGKVRRSLLLRLGSGSGGGSCVELWARGEWRVERGNGKKRRERGLGVCGLLDVEMEMGPKTNHFRGHRCLC